MSNDEIRKTLQPLILTEQKNKITFDFIMNIICDVFDVKKDDLMGKSHAKRFAYPRKLGIYFCRDTLSLTYVKIASLFKKDHSTIMSSYKIIKNNLIKNDVDTLSQVNKIKELIEKY